MYLESYNARQRNSSQNGRMAMTGTTEAPKTVGQIAWGATADWLSVLIQRLVEPSDRIALHSDVSYQMQILQVAMMLFSAPIL